MTQGIYAICHLPTNQFYVGASTNIEKRWEQHRQQLEMGGHHNKKLQELYDGDIEDFVMRVLHVALDKKDLPGCEQFWIKEFGEKAVNSPLPCPYPTATKEIPMFEVAGPAVLAAMKEQGIKQAELARRIGVPRQHISRALTSDDARGKIPPIWEKMLSELGLELVVQKVEGTDPQP